MRFQFSFIILLMVAVIFGCSQGASPITPIEQAENLYTADAFESTHVLWGLWQFVCNPDNGTVDVVPQRYSDLHLNALRFLEPPAGLYLSLESPPQFTGNVLDVDIGLRHPFLGLPQFTGFDVCGILISSGSVSGFDDPDIIMKGEGDTRLINADGYTRWWNPDEFPYNAEHPIYGYQDGLLGMSDDAADYNATLNGYKYFADGLDPDEPVWDTEIDLRGMFAAGQKNVRHYRIEMDEGFVFNYAVDANWKSCGLPPSQIEPPDSFAPEANRPEAWAVSVIETENTLYYEPTAQGGTLGLDILVYDWYNADLNTVYGESLDGIPYTAATGSIDGGENYSTYHLDLTGDLLATDGDIAILITVESEVEDYGGLLPGETVTAYFRHETVVANEGPPPPPEGTFYVCGDKTVFEYGVQFADNEQWLKNMYRKATDDCADNSIVKFYHGHLGFQMPCSQKAEIFGWIEADGYTPVQSSEEPIDTTDCRHIHITMPGRFEPSFYSDDEIADLKQFVNDGGILAIFAEVGYAHPDKTTFNHLIQELGSGCSWGGDYTIEGTTFNTTLFDHDHTMFEGCVEIYWNLPAYLVTNKPTDNVIAWGLNDEAMFVESQIEN